MQVDWSAHQYHNHTQNPNDIADIRIKLRKDNVCNTLSDTIFEIVKTRIIAQKHRVKRNNNKRHILISYIDVFAIFVDVITPYSYDDSLIYLLC
ncbi:hypothetical protein C9980_17765 [Vibrio mediterranei]|nr:hypothetical protein C9980_17765 [Vibrio mediterranei]